MKWFKHMTDMADDTKMRHVIKKFGVEGYGLYNYIIEKIAKRLETNSPLPDLEEQASDIADYLRMDTVRVEEIMLYCMTEGLFSQDEITGRIICRKIYKFLDKSATRSPDIQRMIQSYAESECLELPEVPTSTDKYRQVPTVSPRTDKIRTEEKRIYGVNVALTPTEYTTLCTDFGQRRIDDYIDRLSDYIEQQGKNKYKSHAATIRNWLRRDGVAKLSDQQAPSGRPRPATIDPDILALARRGNASVGVE